MSRLTLLRTLSLAAVAVVHAQIATAQQEGAATQQPPAQQRDWYYSPTTPTVEMPPIAVQKAQLRAQQRMARLEAQRRYGLSPNRPPAVAVPFTSVHTLSWMRDGRSPFIYYRSDRSWRYYAYPNVIWR